MSGVFPIMRLAIGVPFLATLIGPTGTRRPEDEHAGDSEERGSAGARKKKLMGDDREPNELERVVLPWREPTGPTVR